MKKKITTKMEEEDAGGEFVEEENEKRRERKANQSRLSLPHRQDRQRRSAEIEDDSEPTNSHRTH